MSAPSYIYLLISLLLVIFTIWQRRTIKYPARRSLVVRLIWLTLALVMAAVVLLNGRNSDTIVGGIFITVFLLTLFLWYPGLGEWGVLTSLRQIQSYQAFTKYEMKELSPGLTEVQLFRGDVLITALKIKGKVEIVARFLSRKIKPTAER